MKESPSRIAIGVVAATLLGIFLSPSVSAQSTPSATDLFDTSQNVFITSFGPAPLDSRTDIRNIFGGEFGSVEIGNTFFQDRLPAGTTHSVEWVTPTPVELSQVVIFASHAAPPLDANVRGFRTLRFFAANPGQPYQLIHEFSPTNPYGGGPEGNELVHEITLDKLVAQRFRAEFVQFGDSRPTASGPRIIEVDGFGEALPVPDMPAPTTDDLWDIQAGTVVTNHSGVTTQHHGADIRDMFGGTFWQYTPDFSKTVFRDDKLTGFVHFVEWQTIQPIKLQSFQLLADHGDFNPQDPSELRDANARGFSRFTLFAKDNDGSWQKLHEHTPTNPYGQGPAPYFNRLALEADIPGVTAQEFRAEFEQFGDIHPLARGPRIEELDGFGEVVTAPKDPEPIVLVPGMVVSQNKKLLLEDKPGGTWDFAFGYRLPYKGLIQKLEAAGMKENEKLFVAHYDWRNSITDSAANYLKPIIDQVKLATGASKVDIVAHSMGGLVARSYIQGTNYQNDVDQLITLGTPHEGSADAYVAWEGGEFPVGWGSFIIRRAESIEKALKQSRNHQDLKRPETFRTYFPSLRDLLPVEDYVTRDSVLLPVGNLTEQNPFLKNLQQTFNRIAAREVKLTTIAGNGLATLDQIALTNSRSDNDVRLNRWRDGHANPDPPLPNSTAGDGRVLLNSAHVGTENITLSNAEHHLLANEAQDHILQILGFDPISPKLIFNLPGKLLDITILSPVDAVITGPDGKILSRDRNDFGEEIANYDDDPNDPDDPKVITLLDFDTGTYTVTLTGSGTGNYTVITCYADVDESRCTTREGTTTAGKVETYKVHVSTDTFKAPPEDIWTLTDKLWRAIPRLTLEKHIQLQATSPLLGPAGTMYNYATAYKSFAGLLGFEHATTKQYFNLLKQEFAKFKTALEQQIQLQRLDNIAIDELTSLQDELEEAGL